MEHPADKSKLEIYSLTLQAIEGRISESDFICLETYLQKNPDALDIYSDLNIMYAYLRKPTLAFDDLNVEKESSLLNNAFWQTLAEYEKTARKIEIFKQEPSRELIRKVVYPPREKAKLSKFSKIFLAMSTAAVLFMVLFLKYLPIRTVLPVAKVSDEVNAEWLSAFGQIDLESELYPGPLTLKKGFAEIVLNSGARLLLEAPVKIDLETASRVYLERGRLVANIEQSAEDRFVVRMANSTVVDFGTEFGVEVDETGQTNTYVFKGTVELRQGSDPLKYDNKLPLQAGQSGRVRRSGELVRVPAEPQHFINVMPSPYEYAVLKTRPLYYGRFEQDQQSLLRNRMDLHINPKNKLMGTVHYVEGPNLGDNRANNALYLSGDENDYGVISDMVSEIAESGALTLALWVRSEPAKAPFRTIMYTRNESEGYRNSNHLRMTDDNKFDFVMTGEDRGEDVTIDVLSNPVAVNQWNHVVVSYSGGGELKLYVNGRLEASRNLTANIQTLPSDIFWCIGSGPLGFNSIAESSNDIAPFKGCIDEVSLYNRAITAEEVRMLYKAAGGNH